jgi:adenosine deaminase
MQTQEVLRDVGVAYAKELRSQNVIYAEGRFAPQYHLREGLSIDEAIQSIQEGLAEGCERFNVKINLIIAIGRESDSATAESIARAATRNRVVVGLDLAGPEAGNPPERFEKPFAIAMAAGLKKTVHAGEGAGSTQQNLANIRTAMVRLGAERIGHAIDLAKDEELVELARKKHVTIEMNPQSNKVLAKIRSFNDLRIDGLLARGVNVTVNSDDPALWPHGWIGEVLYGVCRSYRFGLNEVDRFTSNAIEGAFLEEKEKQHLTERYAESRRTVS